MGIVYSLAQYQLLFVSQWANGLGWLTIVSPIFSIFVLLFLSDVYNICRITKFKTLYRLEDKVMVQIDNNTQRRQQTIDSNDMPRFHLYKFIFFHDEKIIFL